MDSDLRFTTDQEGRGSAVGRLGPVHGWKESLLACLPFLLIMVYDLVPRLLVEKGLLTWEHPGMQLLNTVLGIFLLGGAILLVLFLAWRRMWPLGMVTWYLIFGVALLLLAGTLLSVLLGEDPNSFLSQGATIYVVIPLMVAVVVYIVARRDPRLGLLAALPVLYILWMIYNSEFVPNMIQVIIKVLSTALVCLAIAFLLRNRNWRTGLYVVLAMNLVVGALFSYAGIYHGGTLPFSASSPNAAEVARSLIPQYLATSAILLGFLFARKFRQVGQSAGGVGRFAYHLALSGLLLVILGNLTSFMLTMDTSVISIASSISSVLAVVIFAGLCAYLLGFVFTHRQVWFEPGITGWVERLLLLILPLAIPIIFMYPFITSTWPVSSLYGIPLLWVLPDTVSLSIGLVWLGLSMWVVTRGSAQGMPA